MFVMKQSIILIILFIGSILSAQVNIEKYNSLDNIEGLTGNIGFYISAKTGNTDIQEFDIDGRINYSEEKFYSFLIGNGEYGWNKGVEFSNSALLHLRYIRKMYKNFNPELFAQINYNKSRLLLFRSLTGIGLRTTIISDSTTSFNFGTAYMFEHENLDLDKMSTHPDVTNHHIWSNYLSYSASFTRHSHISIVIYAQPRLDRFSDIRLLSENHLSARISKHVSLAIKFSLIYDSKPPDGVKDLDTTTKFGFTIRI